ncbi:MAG: hypothetical protein ACXQTI_01525 [Candidatus Nezhaarchaeales archaeon]
MKDVTVTLNVGGETITISPTDNTETTTYTKTFTEDDTYTVQVSTQGVTSQLYLIEVTTPLLKPFLWGLLNNKAIFETDVEEN